ncbi:MAG: VOC family protein [Thermoleophilia bacterium]
MGAPFVWFDLVASDPEGAAGFYRELLGWEAGPPVDDLGGVRMLGGAEPWGLVAGGEPAGWVPYAQVEDVSVAVERARGLGARVLQDRTQGPAGWYAIVAAPDGGRIALWQPAAG